MTTQVDQNRGDDGRISQAQSDVQPKDTKSITWESTLAKAKSHYSYKLAEAGLNVQWNLYHLRQSKGWTQAELGKKIGLLQPHIHRHENGWWPNMRTLAKYAHVYGVSISDIVGEPMNIPPVGYSFGTNAVTFHRVTDLRLDNPETKEEL